MRDNARGVSSGGLVARGHSCVDAGWVNARQ